MGPFLASNRDELERSEGEIKGRGIRTKMIDKQTKEKDKWKNWKNLIFCAFMGTESFMVQIILDG